MPFYQLRGSRTTRNDWRVGGHAWTETKRYDANQIRCSCPIHGGEDTALAISPGVRSKRGSPGVFFCQKAKSGGDRIGLALQLPFFEMGALSDRLVSSTPEWPCDDVCGLDPLSSESDGDAADFLDW
jgi:hypothetical protein